ncbi:UDP-N-acetyl-D-mannosamine dehydrogenase [Gammaproteobacteria bacterium]|nr:UDP-N-acetyl-D-mannosamine dehydrogenase [Gammaproteobacteria bacterium]
MNLKNKTNFKKICVIGLGYVGLPTAAIIANQGITVSGVDVNKTTVETINKGEIHIIEPDLDIMVRNAVNLGKLYASTSIEPADAFIIAVPTPFKDKNEPDLKYLEQAIKAVASVLNKGNLVVLESTSPVGTTKKVSRWLSDARPDLKFPDFKNTPNSQQHNIYIAHSPERVLPGHILVELVKNDRVIGGLTRACSERAKDLYSHFVTGTCHLTDANTAELVKLAENAYRDTNIAFANEMSLICDKLNVDTWDMIDLANLHPRVDILKPGPGVGGHCIAVDPWFIVHSAPKQTPLIQASRKVNDTKPDWVIGRALELTDPVSTIACLGLSYKSDIDDLRESPALKIIKSLAAKHLGPILVVEPNIPDLPPYLSSKKNIKYCLYDQAIQDADTVIVLTDHKEFKNIDLSRLDNKMVIDTRGIWRKDKPSSTGSVNSD